MSRWLPRNTLWAIARLRQPAIEAMPEGLATQAGILAKALLLSYVCSLFKILWKQCKCSNAT